MSKFKVEITQGRTTQSRVIESDSKDDVEEIIKHAAEMTFSGIGSIKITEVKEYHVEWIGMHSWQGYAIDEDDAEHAAIEYSKTHNTFDDHSDFDVEEIEPDQPEIEVSPSMIFNYNTQEFHYKELSDD